MISSLKRLTVGARPMYIERIMPSQDPVQPVQMPMSESHTRVLTKLREAAQDHEKLAAFVDQHPVAPFAGLHDSIYVFAEPIEHADYTSMRAYFRELCEAARTLDVAVVLPAPRELTCVDSLRTTDLMCTLHRHDAPGEIRGYVAKAREHQDDSPRQTVDFGAWLGDQGEPEDQMIPARDHSHLPALIEVEDSDREREDVEREILADESIGMPPLSTMADAEIPASGSMFNTFNTRVLAELQGKAGR